MLTVRDCGVWSEACGASLRAARIVDIRRRTGSCDGLSEVFLTEMGRPDVEGHGIQQR